MKELTEEDFMIVVEQSKRGSNSSIFSKRDYSVLECAMTCDRMAKLLVRFFNVMIKSNHFPCGQLCVLDIMIEKEKVNRASEIRVMQTIEADLQLFMRIFLRFRIVNNYENYMRMSNDKYGSRKGYSIDSALLENF